MNNNQSSNITVPQKGKRTLKRSMATIELDEFDSLIEDEVRAIRKNNIGYCFSPAQKEAIKKEFENLNIVIYINEVKDKKTGELEYFEISKKDLHKNIINTEMADYYQYRKNREKSKYNGIPGEIANYFKNKFYHESRSIDIKMRNEEVFKYKIDNNISTKIK